MTLSRMVRILTNYLCTNDHSIANASLLLEPIRTIIQQAFLWCFFRLFAAECFVSYLRQHNFCLSTSHSQLLLAVVVDLNLLTSLIWAFFREQIKGCCFFLGSLKMYSRYTCCKAQTARDSLHLPPHSHTSPLSSEY